LITRVDAGCSRREIARSPIALPEDILAEHRSSTRVAAVVDLRSRAGDWLRRYGTAEVVGIGAALIAARLAESAGLHAIALAYAATIGENLGFYGTIVARQVAHDVRLARAVGDRYTGRRIWKTTRDILIEFGPAELLDSFVIRPLAMGVGVRFLGRNFGVILGKLVADITFYVPVIVTYEVRRSLEREPPE
jgi:hypothetical protein